MLSGRKPFLIPSFTKMVLTDARTNVPVRFYFAYPCTVYRGNAGFSHVFLRDWFRVPGSGDVIVDTYVDFWPFPDEESYLSWLEEIKLYEQEERRERWKAYFGYFDADDPD